jgi:hypothetical protein
MLKTLQYFAVVIAILFGCWILGTSSSFQSCIIKQAATNTEQSKENPPPFTLAVSNIAAIYVRCTSHLIYEYRDAATAIATGFIALFTFTLWRSTYKLWAAGEKQLTAAQRPWVSIDIAAMGPFKFSESEARIVFRFMLKNVGNSPANHVTIECRLLAEPLGEVEEIKRLRREIATRKMPISNVLGHSIFPGEIGTEEHSIPLSKDDWFKIPELAGWATPTVVGAVVYCSDFAAHYLHTTFVATIRKKDPQNPHVGLGIKWQSSSTEIALDDLIFTKGFIGGSAV